MFFINCFCRFNIHKQIFQVVGGRARRSLYFDIPAHMPCLYYGIKYNVFLHELC